MLDIQIIRDNPEKIKKATREKGFDETAKAKEVNLRFREIDNHFNKMDDRFNKIEKLILVNHE